MTVMIPAEQAPTTEAKAARYLDAVTALLDRTLLAEIGWQPLRQRFRSRTTIRCFCPDDAERSTATHSRALPKGCV